VYKHVFDKHILADVPLLTLPVIMGAWDVLAEGAEDYEVDDDSDDEENYPYETYKVALTVLRAVLTRLRTDNDVVVWAAKQQAAAAARSKHPETNIPDEILFVIKARLSSQPTVLEWANTTKPTLPVPADVLDTIVQQLSPPLNPLGGTAGMQEFVEHWWPRVAAWNLSDFWQELVDILVFISPNWSVFAANTWDAVLAGFRAKTRTMADDQFRTLLQRTAAKRHYDGICLLRMDILATPPGTPPNSSRIRALIASPHKGAELILQPIPSRRNTFQVKALSKRGAMTFPVFQCLVSLKLGGFPGAEITKSELFAACVKNAAKDPVDDDLVQKATWLLDTYAADITISVSSFETVLRLPAQYVQFMAAALQHFLSSPENASFRLGIEHVLQWVVVANSNSIDPASCTGSTRTILADRELCMLKILSKQRTYVDDANIEAAYTGFALMLDYNPGLLQLLVNNATFNLVMAVNGMIKPAIRGIAQTFFTRWALASGFAPILSVLQREAEEELAAVGAAEAAYAAREALMQRVRAETLAQDELRRRQFQRERGADTEEQARALLRHDADAASRVIADELTKRAHTYELNSEHPDVYDKASPFTPDDYSVVEYSTRKAAYTQAMAAYKEAKLNFTDKVKDVVTEYPPPQHQQRKYQDELRALQRAVERLRAALLHFYRYQEYHSMLQERTTRQIYDVMPTIKQEELRRVHESDGGAIHTRWLATGRDEETGAEVFRSLFASPPPFTAFEVATDATLDRLGAMTSSELQDAADTAARVARDAAARQRRAARVRPRAAEEDEDEDGTGDAERFAPRARGESDASDSSDDLSNPSFW
jgi:hypothetical protein